MSSPAFVFVPERASGKLCVTNLLIVTAERIRNLMEFYEVPAYWPDEKMIDIHPDDDFREIKMNIETCMEELAMSFGLNWHKIDGLALPPGIPPDARPPPLRQQQHQQYHPNGRESTYNV